MRSNRKWGFVVAILMTTGLAVSAQAQPRTHRGPAPPAPVLASTYDPYTLHKGPCPQGAPWGGNKCDDLLPLSRSRIG
jgi:hypothetical protein